MSHERPPLPRLALVEGDGALYVSAPKIHAREVDGRFQRLRRLAAWLLLGAFYATAWIQWDGRQILLFDLPARRFHVFGLDFWPQDFYLLSWLLILAGLSLFFFTALAGRLWCGYACPQTVWTEAFVAIERLVEGDRGKRLKLDAAPWTAAKLARKAGKQALWIAFAGWTGFTFVGYFVPIRELGPALLAGQASGWAWFWMLFYGLATYGNAAYLREQVCTYLCPYARFQGAMLDPDSRVIAYDRARGEPRGGRRRGVDPRALGLGDCIDCTLCVQVCPTGIDIRDGLQYTCIACGACVDACDQVMDKVGYPRGLIRYASEHQLAGLPSPWLRPRVLIYGALLALLTAGFAWAVLARPMLHLEVLRDRHALFREDSAGRVENSYLVKVLNKDRHPRELLLSVAGESHELALIDEARLTVPPESVLAVPVAVRNAGERGRDRVRFELRASDGTVEARFLSQFFAPDARSDR